MKTITLTINIPDDKPYYINVNTIEGTPAGKSDSDRIREVTREVWIVDAGETTARRLS